MVCVVKCKANLGIRLSNKFNRKTQPEIYLSAQWATLLTGRLSERDGEAARTRGLTPGKSSLEPLLAIFKKTSRVAFILGGTLNVSLQKEVEDEAAQFGDIVQVSFCVEMRTNNRQ